MASISIPYPIQNTQNTSEQVWGCACHTLEAIYAKIMKLVTMQTFAHAGAHNVVVQVKYD